MKNNLEDLVANLILDVNKSHEMDKETLYQNCKNIIEFLDIEYARELNEDLDDIDSAFDDELDPSGGRGLYSHE